MKKLFFVMLNKISKFFLKGSLKELPKLSKMRDILYRATNPNEILLITVMNNKMYVNSEDIGIASPLIKFGIYEEYSTKVFKNLIKSNTTMIDIGANIGYYTLIAADMITDGIIYSFEPVKANYDLLIKNININSFSNIKSFQKAVSDKSGKDKIFIDGTNLGNHSLTENNIVDRSNFDEIETISLDSFLDNSNENVTDDIVIKMDTQGSEGLIIKGSEKFFLNNKNIKILMEFWPKGLRNMGTDPLELLNKLQSYGFEIKLLDEKNKSLKNCNKKNIIDFCDDPTEIIDQVNLLLEKGN